MPYADPQRNRDVALARYYADHAQNKRRTRARNTRRYAARRSAGLCTACAKPSAMAVCQDCEAKKIPQRVISNRRRMNIQWLAGMCKMCTNPREDGKQQCAECLARGRQVRKAYYAAKAARCECRDCKSPQATGKTRCAACLAQYRREYADKVRSASA